MTDNVIPSGAKRNRGIRNPLAQNQEKRAEKNHMNHYYVYILASATNVTLYIGVTSDLIKRVYEHRTHADPDSFTSKYNVYKLVYFEETTDVKVALEREKQLKRWRREKKNFLVEMQNPQWVDLYPGLLG